MSTITAAMALIACLSSSAPRARRSSPNASAIAAGLRPIELGHLSSDVRTL